MAIATTPLVLAPPQEPPRRSPRTSLILAELTRQRRGERQQRRQARARWAGWLALVDRRPFESVRMQAVPCLLFTGALPLVWAPNLAGLDGSQSPQARC
jgi:hypothetical protein